MASLTRNLVLRVGTPSPLLATEEKIKDLAGQVNLQLDLLTDVLRKLFGETGEDVPFEADIDMQGNSIVNLADPDTAQGAVNRRFLETAIEQLRDELAEIQDTIHNELPVGGQPIVLTRAVPTTVDDIVEIGNFTLTNSAHTFDIAITVSVGGFSVAKAYTLVTNFSINSDWQTALPLVDTGPYSSQDYALDVMQVDADNKLFLRLRRTAGTTAGTATIQIHHRGVTADLFTDTSDTDSVTAPTTFLESAILTVRDGHVGINTKTLNYAGAGTSLTIEGSEGGDNRAAITLRNPDPGTTTTVGEVRFRGEADTLMLVDAVADGAADAAHFRIRLKATGVAIATALILTSLKNLILGGGTAAGSSAEKTLVIGTGVAPGSSPADSVQLYSADQTAGNATLHIRTENGTIILLFQGAALTAANAGALSTGGAAVLSTADSNIIANMRTRINELEARLQALGLLA